MKSSGWSMRILYRLNLKWIKNRTEKGKWKKSFRVSKVRPWIWTLNEKYFLFFAKRDKEVQIKWGFLGLCWKYFLLSLQFAFSFPKCLVICLEAVIYIAFTKQRQWADDQQLCKANHKIVHLSRRSESEVIDRWRSSCFTCTISLACVCFACLQQPQPHSSSLPAAGGNYSAGVTGLAIHKA